MDLSEYQRECLESPIVEGRGWSKFIHSPKAGIFVPKESALTAEWKSSFDTNYEYVGVSKNISGYLFEAPNICIVAESPCLKQTAYMEGSRNSKQIVGLWNSAVDQKERAVTGCTPVSKILFFLLDNEGKSFHNVPLQLTVSGMYGKQFKDEYVAFCKQMCSFLHGKSEALAVFCQKMGVERQSCLEWLSYGSRNGPNKAALKLLCSSFIYRPKFESNFATNSRGKKNALKTCNTVGHGSVDESCIAVDVIFFQQVHRNSLNEYDKYKQEKKDDDVIEKIVDDSVNFE